MGVIQGDTRSLDNGSYERLKRAPGSMQHPLNAKANMWNIFP